MFRGSRLCSVGKQNLRRYVPSLGKVITGKVDVQILLLVGVSLVSNLSKV